MKELDRCPMCGTSCKFHQQHVTLECGPTAKTATEMQVTPEGIFDVAKTSQQMMKQLELAMMIVERIQKSG